MGKAIHHGAMAKSIGGAEINGDHDATDNAMVPVQDADHPFTSDLIRTTNWIRNLTQRMKSSMARQNQLCGSHYVCLGNHGGTAQEGGPQAAQTDWTT